MVSRISFLLVLQAVIGGVTFGTGEVIAGGRRKGVSRATGGSGVNVTYDGRSLIIGGQRKILFSGSIHYPRSTPQMWPSLVAKAKDGGLDVIDTYVFWNLHEPHPGQYDFSGRRDIVRFIKLVQAQGLYVCLRIGPFIEAEWSYGGLPFWLRDIPGIVYRSDNEPFKAYMKNFTTKIVKMMQSEKLYAPQGGPIILSQIENEYGLVEGNFGEKGPPYVKWAAKMAVGLNAGVPWVMCRQDDAPDPVINTCNGKNCGVNFDGPNSPDKPSIWTENWTTRYQVYGKDAKVRSVEDIAFHTALFIVTKNGSFANYYMYHGGTNFGRTAAAFVTTNYYDQAPLDEYGLIRQPKWGHLRDLHAAIKRCSYPLLSGMQHVISLGQLQHAYIFEGPSRKCAAFLVNDDTKNVASIELRNTSYDLPPKSISILPDCKNVAFNTARVSAQYNTRTMTGQKIFSEATVWKEFKEAIPNFDDTSMKSSALLEQMKTTKDASDYLWYTFRFKQESSDKRAVLSVKSAGHVLHAFVNGKAVGSARRSHESKTFDLGIEVALHEGVNYVSLLSVMVGLPDSGAYLERRVSGLRRVTVHSEGYEKQFTKYPWGYQVGLMGEKLKIFTPEASNLVQWNQLSSTRNPLTWYQTLFDAPGTDAPVALNLGSMGKGEAWVNGQSIGRYWPSYLSPNGSSQIWYHIPHSFLKPKGNLLVLLEEEGGNPLKVSLDAASISQVCGHVSNHLPPGSPLEVHDQRTKARRKINGRISKLRLSCLSNGKISNILFASYGTPLGTCGVPHSLGMCHASNSKAIAEKACLGKTSCSIPISNHHFGGDPCSAKPKSLLVVAECK